ncbi:MAG: hypothetical protein J6Q38_06390 [Clostridia bacterium]|nr:hypothetical protein [Clostridia bacterium]
MSVNPEFDKLKSTECVTVSASSGVECKLPITEEEAKNVISSEISTYLISSECLNKEIKYSGRAVFTVLYKSGEEIKKYEAGVEYSFKFDCDKSLEGMPVLADVKGDNVKITFLNGIVTASAVILFTGELSKPNDLEFFVKDPNLTVKNKSVDYSYEVCKIKRECKIEDEFDLDLLIKDVLFHKEKAYSLSCTCGIGSIIVDGEIELTALINPLEEGKEPILEARKIPFRLEVDSSDSLPDLLSSCFVVVKNCNLKVYVDENKNKSAVSVELVLEVNASLYALNSFSLAVDAYSNECEIKINKECKDLSKVIGFKCGEDRVKSEISFDVDKNSRLICPINDRIEDVKYSIDDNGVLIVGVMTVTCLFLGETLFTDSITFPFSAKINIEGNKIFAHKIQALNLKVTKTFIEFDLKLCFTDICNTPINFINAIEEGQKRKVNDSAISVFIPTKDDSLWDISKALGVKEEEILISNPDLEFPLTGNERIVVYREK